MFSFSDDNFDMKLWHMQMTVILTVEQLKLNCILTENSFVFILYAFFYCSENDGIISDSHRVKTRKLFNYIVNEMYNFHLCIR